VVKSVFSKIGVMLFSSTFCYSIFFSDNNLSTDWNFKIMKNCGSPSEKILFYYNRTIDQLDSDCQVYIINNDATCEEYCCFLRNVNFYKYFIFITDYLNKIIEYDGLVCFSNVNNYNFLKMFLNDVKLFKGNNIALNIDVICSILEQINKKYQCYMNIVKNIENILKPYSRIKIENLNLPENVFEKLIEQNLESEYYKNQNYFVEEVANIFFNHSLNF
jgi:hypothetical protein